jgi:hypothetical protein
VSIARVITLLLITASCRTHLGPKIDLDPVIISEWGAAQVILIEQNWQDYFQIDRVKPQMFNFTEHAEPFHCNGQLANGCFSPPWDITYNKQTPQVIRHEAGHAILYRVRDYRWRCFEHKEKCSPSHDEYEDCRDSPTCQ